MSETIEYVNHQGGRFKILEKLQGNKLRLMIKHNKFGPPTTKVVKESEVERIDSDFGTGGMKTIGFFHRRRR